MSSFTLDEILNSVSIPLELSGVSFRLRPMSSRAIAAWNRLQAQLLDERKKPEETFVEYQERNTKLEDKSLQMLAEHMRGCVTSGDAKKVTGKWLGEEIPHLVVQDIARFVLEGTRPAWAPGGAEGN